MVYILVYNNKLLNRKYCTNSDTISFLVVTWDHLD